MRRIRGFTLIELMIVVVVIALLAMVAYPSYQNSMRKSRRASAQTYLMDLAQREQQFFLDNRRYASKADLNVVEPAEVARYYDVTVTIDNAAAPPTFVITATPSLAIQQPDGSLTINQAGAKTPTDKW
jgi:type IV pilus assembly protein PilE